MQIAQWQAHKDIIKTVKYIKETDIPIIFTAAMDKMARIWSVQNDRVVPMGTLRQGYMLKQDYVWKFPLYNHESKTVQRQDDVQHMLDDLRK